MVQVLEKLLTDAEGCELISRLATDPLRRDIFKRIADQFRLSAADVERLLRERAHTER